MQDKFQNKYRIPSARLQNWDYSWNAAYFVTICTKDRQNYFGEIRNTEMYLSDIGQLAQKFWQEIPSHFPFVELNAFVVMPNHVHGLLVFNKPENQPYLIKSENVETRQCLVSTDPETYEFNQIPIGKKRFQNQGKYTLSSVIGSYKSVVSKFARKIHADFAWQARFHDHIIRNEISFNQISDYIIHNPEKWEADKFYNNH